MSAILLPLKTYAQGNVWKDLKMYATKVNSESEKLNYTCLPTSQEQKN